MSGISLRYPKLNGIPVPDDGVSPGKISAQGITAYIEVDGVLLQGNYSFDTLTITLKGITTPPFSKPDKTGLGSTFSYSDRTWRILDIQEGACIYIAGTKKFFSWSVTGVDMDSGRAVIG